MSLAFVLDHRADVDPDGDAISDGSQSLTNDELLHRVRAASRHLRDLGLRPGDVVALKLTNRIEFVVLLFAAWRLGAAVAPIDPSLTDGDVDRQLDEAGARLLVTEDSPTEHTSVTTLAVDTLNQCLGWEDLPAPPDPSALALLIYTSGTTGGPHGVMLDHAKVDAMAAMERDALELGPADRCRLNLPLFHVNGIVVSVLTPLLAGASIVIADRFDPTNAIGKIDKRERRAAHELSNGSNR
jgi:long-chain acyl-CoA synthetase